MLHSTGLLLAAIVCLFRSRRSLWVENAALRLQLAVYRRRKHPRPRLILLHKLFRKMARRFWSGWKQALLSFSPETVVRWHRSGFALYWRAISGVRRAIGRKRASKELRHLIFRRVAEDPTWGAPRIHGELLMLGFDVSERTVPRWVKRAPRDPEPAKPWLAVTMDGVDLPPSSAHGIIRHSNRLAATRMSVLGTSRYNSEEKYAAYLPGSDTRQTT